MKISQEEYERRKKEYTFCCPNCGGVHFDSNRNRDGSRTVTCHGVEHPSRGGLPGQPACGWSGQYSYYVNNKEGVGGWWFTKETKEGCTEMMGVGNCDCDNQV